MAKEERRKVEGDERKKGKKRRIRWKAAAPIRICKTGIINDKK